MFTAVSGRFWERRKRRRIFIRQRLHAILGLGFIAMSFQGQYKKNIYIPDDRDDVYPLGFLDRLTAKSYHCCVRLNGSIFIKNAEQTMAEFGGRSRQAAELVY